MSIGFLVVVGIGVVLVANLVVVALLRVAARSDRAIDRMGAEARAEAARRARDAHAAPATNAQTRRFR